MPRRKSGQEDIRSLQQMNGYYHVTIPISFIRKLGWREHQKLVVKPIRAGLALVDWKVPRVKKKS